MTRRLWFWLVAGSLLLGACGLQSAPATPTPLTTPLWTPIPLQPPVVIPPTVTPTPARVPSPAAVTPTASPGGSKGQVTVPPLATATPTWPPLPQAPGRSWTPVVPVRPGPVLYIPRKTFTFQADGDLREWLALSPVSITYVTFGQNNYQGPQDASGTLYLAWDEQYLYLAFQVLDDRYVQEAQGRYLYQGDSVEILVDTDLMGDRVQRRLSRDDYQIGFSPGNPLGSQLQAWRWYPRPLEQRLEGFPMAARAWTHGYQLEIALPWDVLHLQPRPGLRVGFNAAISDNDLPGQRIQQTLVSTSPYRRLTDPTTWGELVLLP